MVTVFFGFIEIEIQNNENQNSKFAIMDIIVDLEAGEWNETKTIIFCIGGCAAVDVLHPFSILW
jgi:hypothetical protein